MRQHIKFALMSILTMVAASTISTGYAKESYDMTTGILTIPKLIASDGTGNTPSILASDIKISLGSVISYDRAYNKELYSVPSHTAFYNLATGSLTLPFVVADELSEGYENVKVTVGNVIEIGNSEDIPAEATSFQFTPYIDTSLPLEWKTEFENILLTLQKDIPIYAKDNSYGMGVFAWNDDVTPPYDFLGAGEACICGNGYREWMSLAIPNNEFEWEAMHRYSVIPHEYFHVFQINHAPDQKIKWLMEGGAATVESLYVQEHYDYNYFLNDLAPGLDSTVVVNPELYESYEASDLVDQNYSGSVFITLVLIEELQKNGLSESESLSKVLYEFFKNEPRQSNWKTVFNEVFGFSLEDFYEALKSYEASYESLIPSAEIRLNDIF